MPRGVVVQWLRGYGVLELYWTLSSITLTDNPSERVYSSMGKSWLFLDRHMYVIMSAHLPTILNDNGSDGWEFIDAGGELPVSG